MQAQLINVVRPCWISKLEAFNGMWHLSENGKPQGHFDAIVIAHNAFEDPLPFRGNSETTPFEGAFVKEIDALSWMGNNTKKLLFSQRNFPHCWTFFSTAAYGKRNKVPQYLKHRGLLQVGQTKKDSYTWRGILKGWTALQDGLKWRFGYGDSVSFWHDWWCGDGPLADSFEFISQVDLNLRVSEVRINQSWDYASLSTAIPDHIQSIITGTPISFTNRPDTLILSHSRNGVFSVLRSSPHEEEVPWKWIWKLQRPQKFNYLLWLGVHERLLTQLQRFHHNLAPSPLCQRCGEADEAVFHLFRDCRAIHWFWNRIRGPTGGPEFYQGNFVEWISGQCRQLVEPVWRQRFLAGLWVMWRTRNMHIIQGQLLPKELILGQWVRLHLRWLTNHN
ncbi:hypothetical protein Syun_029614 [Stephania yunnanensis]|uniref:Reverse transcriptase zinc-binding domain-containing protein n=1 Tax=Stephania yunnanensis TaxID=152371 RepID=A0AAP0E5Q0_9MAGN